MRSPRKKFKNSYLVTIFVAYSILLGCFELQSKDLAQYGIRHFDKKEGLSASTILHIHQSSSGYLWTATYEGLNRFDGAEFSVFNALTTPSLPSDIITCVTESSDNVLWVGTLEQGAIGYLDPELKKVKPNSILKDKGILCFLSANDGTVFAGTKTGLFQFKDDDWEQLDFLNGRSNVAVRKLAIDSNGNLYIATEREILYYDYEKSVVVSKELPPGLSTGGMCYHEKSGLWVGTQISGLYQFKDNRVTHFTEGVGILNNSIGDVTTDLEGNLWIGSKEGISKMQNGVFSHYRLKGGSVFSLFPDNEGGMWAGTYQTGLYRFGDNSFSSYTNYNYHEETVRARTLIQLNNQLLVGTNQGIFFLADGYLHQAPRFKALENTVIRSFYPSYDKGIWVGTYSSGLFKIYADGKTQKWDTSDGLISMTIRSTFEHQDGSVWLGTNQGLQIMRNGNFETFDPINGNPVLSIHQIETDSILVATDGDGFYVIRDDSMEHYTQEDGLSSSIVFSATQDENGGIWVCTSNGGLSYLSDGTIKTFTGKDGLPHDTIFYLFDDHLESYWMGCNSGIYSIAKTTLQAIAKGEKPQTFLKRYDHIDGIMTGGITSVTHPFMDEKNTIWFPSTKGVVSVTPSNLAEAPKPPNAMIRAFETETESFYTHDDESIKIPAGTKRFTFRFSGLSMASGEKTRYQVFLKGFDSSPIEIGLQREFSYTNLKPGDYEFEVRASTSIGQWSETGDILSFSLLPHYYQTKLFAVTMATALILLSASIYLYRTRIIRANERKFRILVEQRTAELQHAVETAKHANDSQSRFLATVSHEVRNPMNGIIGINDLLQKTNLDSEQTRYVELIQKGSLSILTILNDLLDFSKMESHHLHLEEIPFNIRDIIDETLSLQEQRISEKNLHTEVRIDENIPKSLIGDPLRHRQILTNLISNAIKFTEFGFIIIKVSIESEAESEITLRFTVIDTGSGIPVEVQEQLFHEYNQGSNSIARTHGGTGLGLAICKDLVHLMNGKIWFESAENEGATFYFTSTLKIVQEASLEPSNGATTTTIKKLSKQSVNNLQVLILDDEAINLEIASLIFKNIGITVQTSANFEDAVSKLETTSFDMLYLDNYMPNKDGVTVAKEIKSRQIRSLNPNLYIVATTGATRAEDQQKYLEAGMNAIVEKPISLKTIQNSIEVFLEQSSESLNET